MAHMAVSLPTREQLAEVVTLARNAFGHGCFAGGVRIDAHTGALVPLACHISTCLKCGPRVAAESIRAFSWCYAGDLQFLTLTYRRGQAPCGTDAEIAEMMSRDRAVWLKRLKRLCPGLDIPLAWVCRKELGDLTGRPHMHLIFKLPVTVGRKEFDRLNCLAWGTKRTGFGMLQRKAVWSIKGAMRYLMGYLTYAAKTVIGAFTRSRGLLDGLKLAEEDRGIDRSKRGCRSHDLLTLEEVQSAIMELDDLDHEYGCVRSKRQVANASFMMVGALETALRQWQEGSDLTRRMLRRHFFEEAGRGLWQVLESSWKIRQSPLAASLRMA